MAKQFFPLTFRVEPEDHWSEDCGNLVWLGDSLVGYRPYDGSSEEEIVDEATKALTEMLRERLGWKTSP